MSKKEPFFKYRRPPGLLRRAWADRFIRTVLLFGLAAIALAVSINVYTAYVVYDDGRCFWADCKILKGDCVEGLQIGD
jgi:hypothetical protein